MTWGILALMEEMAHPDYLAPLALPALLVLAETLLLSTMDLKAPIQAQDLRV